MLPRFGSRCDAATKAAAHVIVDDGRQQLPPESRAVAGCVRLLICPLSLPVRLNSPFDGSCCTTSHCCCRAPCAPGCAPWRSCVWGSGLPCRAARATAGPQDRPRHWCADTGDHWTWPGGVHVHYNSGFVRAPNNQWAEVCHKVPAGSYEPGARRAVVVIRATDQPSWAGHYGAKLAAPWLSFGLPPPLPAAQPAELAL